MKEPPPCDDEYNTLSACAWNHLEYRNSLPISKNWGWAKNHVLARSAVFIGVYQGPGAPTKVLERSYAGGRAFTPSESEGIPWPMPLLPLPRPMSKRGETEGGQAQKI